MARVVMARDVPGLEGCWGIWLGILRGLNRYDGGLVRESGRDDAESTVSHPDLWGKR